MSVDLLPNGGTIAVTNDNRTLYCHLLAEFHLNRRWGCKPLRAVAKSQRLCVVPTLRFH